MKRKKPGETGNPDGTAGPPVRRNYSFSTFLLLYMILLVLCIVTFITINDYNRTKENFERESALFQLQTELNIREAMRLKDIAWNTYDEILNQKMKTGLEMVLSEYEHSGWNPDQMQLDDIREGLGEGYDIYIINQSGVIVRTTYASELGMNFSSVPYFFDYLTRIRNSEGFFPDRIVHEKLGSGQFRKFAYMPTPDHAYILELGLAEPAFEDLNIQLDDKQYIETIVSVNPYIQEFEVYNSMGRRIEDNSLPAEPVLQYLTTVIAARTDLDVPDPKNGTMTRFLFVDLKNDRYGSDLSRVVEITYNTRMIQHALDMLIISHAVIAIATICAGCILAFFLSRRLNQPILTIARDVDIIARGDLGHRISATRSKEFAVLEYSINLMVDSIKNALQKINDGERFQREMIDQLPVAVFFKRVTDGRYVFWNRTCEQLFGLPSREVIGKTDRELYPGEIADSIEAEDREIVANRTKLRNKIVSVSPVCGKVIHMVIVPIADSEGSVQYLLGVSEDVTQENINIKMDLLFSIARRDILDQLSVIMRSLERAQLISTRESVQMFFDRTTSSVEVMRNQIAFMRSLQELGILMPKWQRVDDSFRQAAGLLPTKTVDIRINTGDIEIYADPLLPRVFFTLIDNSLKHGGPKLAFIGLRAETRGDDLALVFEDNGMGIPEQDKESIFTFGFGKGEGFGLYLIREILTYTGITIREDGIPGKGARFEMLVPKGRFRTKKPD